MKRYKKILPIIIGVIIGISTIVTAATIFNSKDITYSSSLTTKKNVKDVLDELYTKVNTPWKCADGWYCYKQACPDGNLCRETLVRNVQLGDYISMTPTSTSYIVGTDLTGYSSSQSINPSELKLWRVINKNADGSVDVVSEYVSSNEIHFNGKTGYMKFVGTLNTIASQYTNTKYVSKTRHLGYSDQKETCTGTLSATTCPTDNGYEKDINSVRNILGLESKTLDGSKSGYWIASREVSSGIYSGRGVGDGNMSPVAYRLSANMIYKSGSVMGLNGADENIRPVLTLKADIQIKSGDGKSAVTAYQLS